ncbi:hypothetical protein GCM10010193_08120 [Kitasatospora atroaurantiaca]|uniref:Uncharacterized protein n=1 Tax=Kitasatospora atroaurantiaca TaxID=285545 RepID=A0A561EJI6_9ACTN|nr:hypothetical protein [Kitasatospora atroaurantiaca]TWE15769.1 hypothetical protein FB465_0700 [Kitasatospora atroaurantiaca]
MDDLSFDRLRKVRLRAPRFFLSQDHNPVWFNGYEVRPGIVALPVMKLTERLYEQQGDSTVTLASIAQVKPEVFVTEVMDLLRLLEKVPSGRTLVEFFANASVPPPKVPKRPADRTYWEQEAVYADNGCPAEIRLTINQLDPRLPQLTAVTLGTYKTGRYYGAGSVSYVQIHPRMVLTMDGLAISPELIIAHEMIHAAHAVSGAIDEGELNVPALESPGKFATTKSPFEEIVTHGGYLQLTASLGVHHPGGVLAIKATQPQITGLRSAAELARTAKNDDERRRWTRTQCARFDVVGVSEVRLAAELKQTTRRAYHNFISETPRAGILKKARGEVADELFTIPPGSTPDHPLRAKLAALTTWASTVGVVDCVHPAAPDDVVGYAAPRKLAMKGPEAWNLINGLSVRQTPAEIWRPSDTAPPQPAGELRVEVRGGRDRPAPVPASGPSRPPVSSNQVTVFPYLRSQAKDAPEITKRLYRFDLRGPEERTENPHGITVEPRDLAPVFSAGFRAWGTWYDLEHHVHPRPGSWYTQDGFVSLGADKKAAIDLYAPDLVGRVGASWIELATAAIRRRLTTRNLTPAQQVRLSDDLARLTKQAVGDGGVTGWIYSVLPSRYMFHVATNAGSTRQALLGDQARRAAEQNGEWLAPHLVPASAITKATQVTFTVEYTVPKRGGPAEPRYRTRETGELIRKKAEGDPYNPFRHRAQSRWDGLVSYGAPPDNPCLPGHRDFAVPRGWSGMDEYWRNGKKHTSSWATTGITLTPPPRP